MTIETMLAVLGHAADADEIQAVAHDLLAAAAVAHAAGQYGLADRLVEQAGELIALRREARFDSLAHQGDAESV